MSRWVALLIGIFFSSFSFSQSSYLNQVMRSAIEKNIAFYDVYSDCLGGNPKKYNCGEARVEKSEFDRIHHLRNELFSRYVSIYKIKTTTDVGLPVQTLQITREGFVQESVNLQLKLLSIYAILQRDCGSKDSYAPLVKIVTDYTRFYLSNRYSFYFKTTEEFEKADFKSNYNHSYCESDLKLLDGIFVNVYGPTTDLICEKRPIVNISTVFIYLLSKELSGF